MLSNDTRDRVKKAFEPIPVALGRAGLTPDALTIIGFGITIVGAWLLSRQLWLAGGVVVLAGGVFDMFDGTLARATGRVSRWGAFLDSTLDKAGEIVVYVGLVAGLQQVGYLDAPVYAVAALGASVMVSYTRARAEGLGFSAGRGMAAVGIMPREVRLVVLTVGLVLAGLLGTDPCGGGDCGGGAGGAALPLGMLAIFVTLGIIAIGATVTTIQRIVHVHRHASAPAASRPSEQEQS
jgi:phosphatidylglycerophosphate synthase